MTHEPIGGLVGGAAALSNSASNAARKAYGFMANPDAWALRLVFFAGLITILKKAGVFIPEYMVLFGVALGLAALLYEMSASRAAVRAWWEGRPGAMLWSGIIWAVAFGFSVNNWIGAASEGQVDKTNTHKAAYHQATDLRSTIKDLETQLEIKTKSVDWAKTLESPDAYEAKIKAAEADAAYEATRNGCRSKCIAKQQIAASLKADKQNAVNRMETQEEIKILQGKLEDARKQASNTKMEVSEERSDLLILTKYAGMSEEGAQIFNGLFSIMVVSIFLSFGSMRQELEELRVTTPRQRSEMMLKLKTWFCRVFFGRNPREVRFVEKHMHIDSGAAKRQADYVANLQQNRQIYGGAAA